MKRKILTKRKFERNNKEEGDTKYNLYGKKPKKKIPYCPFVFRLVYQKNKLKVKIPTVLAIIPFLNLKEIFRLRLVSKIFNETIADKFGFPELLTVSRSWLIELKNKFESKKEESSHESSKSDIGFFDTNDKSDKKFSKKRTLVKLISSNNYMAIKRRISLTKLLSPNKEDG